jgi:hypothetical protein
MAMVISTISLQLCKYQVKSTIDCVFGRIGPLAPATATGGPDVDRSCQRSGGDLSLRTLLDANDSGVPIDVEVIIRARTTMVPGVGRESGQGAGISGQLLNYQYCP